MKKELMIIALIFVIAIAAVEAAEIENGLILENVDVYPDEITAESNFTLSANIRNVVDRELYSVRLTVKGGFPFSKTSPIYSIYVGTLRSNQYYPISINLSVDKNAEAKEYPLEITANYYVSEPSITRTYYIAHTEALISTIKVEKGVDLEIEKTEFPQKLVADVKDASIYVYIKNTGKKPAREVKLSLASEYPFIPSGKSFFISEINPGETKQAIFHIDIDSAASTQMYPIDLFIEWKENDISYSATKSFGIPVEKSSNVPEFLNARVIVFVIVVVVVSVFIQTRRKRKKK